MKSASEFISSGIIEEYVLGLLPAEELREVEEMAALHKEVKQAIEEFEFSLEKVALEQAVTPDPIIKPFLMATIDLTERMMKGEQLGDPPILHNNSKVSDYSLWLEREDLSLPPNFKEDVYAKIIGYTPQALTAIVWLKELAPQEVHHDEYEKFLIVEGTCTIYVEEDSYDLKPGDYLTIPLHKNHLVKVTSSEMCKVVLQRVAA